jgi:uncharacterized protein (DUF1800 family)
MRIGSSPSVRHRAGFLATAGVVAATAVVPVACTSWVRTTASGTPPAVHATTDSSAGTLSQRERAIHLLNRATYGTRPQDVDDLLRIGIDAWLERQLHPEGIDDSGVSARIEAMAHRWSIVGSVVSGSPRPPAPQAVRIPPPAPRPAPVRRAVPDIPQHVPPPTFVPERRAPDGPRDGSGPGAGSAETARLRARAARLGTEARRVQTKATQLETETARAQANARARAMDGRAQALAQAEAQLRMRAQQAQAEVRVAVVLRQMPDYLAAVRVERAVSSQRQLEEVMADFWFNHFNVFMNKDRVRLVMEDYERDAIRAHVFGRFEDMLIATARHPAMLIYLDNFLSTAPAEAGGHRRGLNENYARELLELHTLGVDGGYTQEDVIEVARAFSGWTIESARPNVPPPPAGGTTSMPSLHISFQFRPDMHDRGEKVVLGHTLPAGRGMEDGLDVLRMLARHLAAEDPPPALVADLTRVFRTTGGNLREVTRALFTAEAFYAPAHFRARAKRPFEFVVSALRVTGAEAQQPRAIVQQLRSFGHLPYSEPAPTGYPVAQKEWISAGAMLARMNFALDLAEGRVAGVRIQPDTMLGEALPATRPVVTGAGGSLPDGADPIDLEELRPRIRALLDRVLVGGDIDELEAALVDGFSAAPPVTMRAMITGALGVALGSPAFQRH